MCYALPWRNRVVRPIIKGGAMHESIRVSSSLRMWVRHHIESSMRFALNHHLVNCCADRAINIPFGYTSIKLTREVEELTHLHINHLTN